MPGSFPNYTKTKKDKTQVIELATVILLLCPYLPIHQPTTKTPTTITIGIIVA